MSRRKPVRRVDNSGQTMLFAGCEGRGQAQHKPESSAGAALFRDPAPEGILVGGQLLRERLEQTGQTEVFLIRRFLRRLEWDTFKEKYQGGGRPAYHPALFLGLVLFGLLNGRSSLRELETFAGMDLRCWWLTGGVSPDHSSIGRFLIRHEEELSEAFFERLTSQILSATQSDSGSLSGDGTVIQAAGSRYRTIKKEAAELRAAEARARASANPTVECFEAAAGKAERVADAARDRAEARRAQGKSPDTVRVSSTEPEAVIQKQKEGFFAPSYTPTVLANEDRIVVAQGVHPTSELALVPKLLDQAQRVVASSDEEESGVNRLLLDAGFFTVAVIALALSADVDLLVPHGRMASGKAPSQFHKQDFDYDEERDTYTCPAGHELHRVGAGSEKVRDRSGRRREFKRYGGAPCAECPQRERCTKAVRGRTLKRYSDESLTEAMLRVMEHPLAQAEYAKRKGAVEPVFASVKDQQRLRRFRRKGLRKVSLEFALHMTAHNLGRYLALERRAEEASHRASAAFAVARAAERQEHATQLRAIAQGPPPPGGWATLSRAA